jgi:RNA polymerase sigma-70 factor (ECF subfamily)
LNPDECLRSWVSQYSNRLTQLAYTYTHDWSSAEDLVQEAFIKAYRSIHQLNDIENPFPWLIRIVINESKTAYRRIRWREILMTVIPERLVRSAEEEYVDMIGMNEMYEAILSLPEKYRTPIVLYYFEDMGLQEIADVLQVNHSTVRTQFARARERLAKHFNRGDKYESGESGRTNSQCKTSL